MKRYLDSDSTKFTQFARKLRALCVLILITITISACSGTQSTISTSDIDNNLTQQIPNVKYPERAVPEIKSIIVDSKTLTTVITWNYDFSKDKVEGLDNVAGFYFYVQSPDGVIRQYQDEMHTISQSYDQIIIEFNHTFKTPLKGSFGKYKFWIKSIDGKLNELNTSEPYEYDFSGYKKQKKSIVSDALSQLNKPHGIAVNPINENVYVSNSKNHTIVIYDKNGNWLDTQGEYGTNKGQFDTLVRYNN